MNDQSDNFYLKNIKYLFTTSDLSKLPNDNLKEIVIVGRSNVGKSTFINTIGNNQKLAKKSNKPGKTRALSLFSVNDKFRLVDIPGYGYANVSKDQIKRFAILLDKYFSERKNLKLAILLLDIRRKISQDDLLMIDYFKKNNLQFKIIGTKLDKVTQKEKAAFKKNIKQILDLDEVILYSSINKFNLLAVKKIFLEYL
ncbi:MAG: putative GTP-binding protein EngB [Candidatus Hepatoplasma scabrum]|nr:MAG: putative GTP-binding protein EngB [Candidatus Hepatoplasma sp.]